MNIECGHCRGRHESVVEVRTCANAHGRMAATYVSGTAEMYKDSTPPVSSRSTTPEIPAGRYAIMMGGKLAFFKVDRPSDGRWAGYTFVKQFSSDIEYPVRGARMNAVLSQIAIDGPESAMLCFGREIGRCGHCGRVLTDEASRSRGIGPVCASKMGY